MLLPAAPVRRMDGWMSAEGVGIEVEGCGCGCGCAAGTQMGRWGKCNRIDV